MDLKLIVESFKAATCVLSVKKLPDGGYGDIRIVTGNTPYLATIETSYVPGEPAKKFIPNSPYETYLPKDMNFEEYCYQSAILGKPLHTYVHPERFNIWFNIYMMPLQSDRDDVGYCTYSMEFAHAADVDIMSNISPDIAAAVLRTCIKLHGSEDFRSAMQEIITDVRNLSNASQCCIMLMDYNTRNCSVLCESTDPERSKGSAFDLINDDFFELADSWMETISGSDCLMLKNEQDMEILRKRNPAWYDSMAEFGVESLLMYPLIYSGNTIGFLWATDFDVSDPIRTKETLELTVYFLASGIANHKMMKSLEIMSTTDLLTGIKNRNAMNNRVDGIVSGAEQLPDSLGVVFADLNGLKTKNDTEGHVAGDLMLKNAANILQNVFVGNEIYRAGGDEFMVIAVNISREEFEARVKKLREVTKGNESVSLAVGSIYDEHYTDIRAAMRLADEMMYKDKEMYYKTNKK